MTTASEINLWGPAVLLVLAALVIAVAPLSRRHQAFGVFVGGYAAWTIVYFLPNGPRAALAWFGFVAIILAAGAAVLLAIEMTRATRAGLALALGVGTTGCAVNVIALATTLPAPTTLLWAGHTLFPAGSSAALVLLAQSEADVSLAAAGLAALAGLVGGRMWLVGPEGLHYGIAGSYSLGLAVASVFWLARCPPLARLALFALGAMLGGILLTVAVGNVLDPTAALLNAAWRTAALGAVAYAIVRQ